MGLRLNWDHVLRLFILLFCINLSPGITATDPLIEMNFIESYLIFTVIFVNFIDVKVIEGKSK